MQPIEHNLVCPVYNCQAVVTAYYSEYKNRNDVNPTIKLTATDCNLKHSGKSCPYLDCPLRKEICQMYPLYEDPEKYR